MLPSKTPMVGCDATFGKPTFLHAVGKVPGDSFRKPTGVDKNQGRAMFGNKISKAVVDLIPNFGRHDRLKRRRWHFNGKVSVTHEAGVDNLTFIVFWTVADQESCHVVDWLLGRGDSNTDRRFHTQGVQAFQG